MKYRFSGDKERVALGDTELISLVNQYLQKHRQTNGKPAITRVLKELGWTRVQWNTFTKKAGKFLIMDYIPEYSVLKTTESGNPELVREALSKRGIRTEEIERRVSTAYGSLKEDLAGLGLTEEEVDGCMAMQTFGENRFANAMEVISSGVFNTAVKLSTQQRMIEDRMKFVREQIKEYGSMVCAERNTWVSEEMKLVKQYALIGQLLADIQETWYQGSAQLALVKMRLRDEKVTTGPTDGNNLRGNNKPRFRPTIIDADEVRQQANQGGVEQNGETPEA